MNNKIKTMLTDNLKSLYSPVILDDYYKVASLSCIKVNEPKILFHDNVYSNSCYNSEIDTIFLKPMLESFIYYRSLIHETIHATGHYTRLNRQWFKSKKVFIRSGIYALEEIIAEYTTAMIMVSCGFKRVIDLSIEYIDKYYNVLGYNPRDMERAIDYSNEAYNYLTNHY